MNKIQFNYDATSELNLHSSREEKFELAPPNQRNEMPISRNMDFILCFMVLDASFAITVVFAISFWARIIRS